MTPPTETLGLGPVWAVRTASGAFAMNETTGVPLLWGQVGRREYEARENEVKLRLVPWDTDPEAMAKEIERLRAVLDEVDTHLSAERSNWEHGGGCITYEDLVAIQERVRAALHPSEVQP